MYAGALEALFFAVEKETTLVTVPETAVKFVKVPAVPVALPQPIVWVSAHAFALTGRATNMTSKRRIVLLYPCNSVKRLFATWAEKVDWFKIYMNL